MRGLGELISLSLALRLLPIDSLKVIFLQKALRVIFHRGVFQTLRNGVVKICLRVLMLRLTTLWADFEDWFTHMLKYQRLLAGLTMIK